VPAGLGVFEAVFIALLSHRISEGQLLAALLGYRAVYYIGPWPSPPCCTWAMELKARRLKKKAHIAPDEAPMVRPHRANAERPLA
jgi:hypothetical protein